MEGDPPSHLRHGAEEKEGGSIRKGQISIKKRNVSTNRMEIWRWRETPRPTCAMEHKKKRGTA